MNAERPYTLVAELTYRCPLHCAYCSNPLDLEKYPEAMDTDTWSRVFREAENIGVVQLHLTGGEPLLRKDLENLIEAARALDLYTNLITSGLPLARGRLEKLRSAGLEHLQLSFQSADAKSSDAIAGTEAFDQKLAVAAWAKQLGFWLTVNVVLHRGNIHAIASIIALAEQLGADRLELANARFLGWAFENRADLRPSREQLQRARDAAWGARERLQGRMEVVYVVPNDQAEAPPPCMDGWGRRYIVVTPDGLVLPCHAAHTIAGLVFDNVRDRALDAIWESSPGLNAFRGEAWMPPVCRRCDRRSVDFGGCRCQAFHSTGDASAVDPACKLSPHHEFHRRSLMRPR